MKVGIDWISFYTPSYYLDLRTLAEKRGVDYDKFRIGLGQEKMAVPPPDEDIISMAANAAQRILDRIDPCTIELLLFATESAVDYSKSAAMFAHGLLKLPTRCRALELKQACYSATAGLQLAADWVRHHPTKKAMILASDIARYDLSSPGEPTQGAGAVAILVSADPGILALDDEYGLYAEDVFDFWRPNYRDEALVDGRYSMMVYITALEETWRQYSTISGRTFYDLRHFCYHLPFTKMAEKAHIRLAKAAGITQLSADDLDRQIGYSLLYNRVTGNTYSASVYEGLCSLLDNAPDLPDGSRVGFFSYGSGCMGEYYSAQVQPGYKSRLFTEEHRIMLNGRMELTYQQYEDIFQLGFPTDGLDHTFAQYRTGLYRLAGVSQHKRLYERIKR